MCNWGSGLDIGGWTLGTRVGEEEDENWGVTVVEEGKTMGVAATESACPFNADIDGIKVKVIMLAKAVRSTAVDVDGEVARVCERRGVHLVR